MNVKSVTVRPAGFENAEAIFGLIKSYPEQLVPRSLSDIVQNIDRFLVADHRGKIVGTVSWQILPEIGAPASPSVEIASLAVAEACQGAGVGADLVRVAIDRIRTLHPAQIIALTFVKGFFEKFGFREVPKETLMHKIYTGCINCTKFDSPFTCPEIAMVLEMPGTTP
jgi:amino-acid N-acetyltransferase